MEKQAILEAIIREGGDEHFDTSITYKLFENPDDSYELKAVEYFDGQTYEGGVKQLSLSREEAFRWIFRFCTDEVSALHVRDVIEDGR